MYSQADDICHGLLSCDSWQTIQKVFKVFEKFFRSHASVSFFVKTVNGFKLLTIFVEKSNQRCLTGFKIYFWDFSWMYCCFWRAVYYFGLLHFSNQPTFIYPKLTIKTLEQGVKYVQSSVVLISLLLTLNM